jgi:hypothetical protein
MRAQQDAYTHCTVSVFPCRFRALLERGLVRRQLHLWHAAPPKCCGDSQVQAVQLEAMSCALFVLAAGIVMSFVVLLIECKLQHNRCKRQCKQNVLTQGRSTPESANLLYVFPDIKAKESIGRKHIIHLGTPRRKRVFHQRRVLS